MIEEENKNPGENTIPTGAKLYRALTQPEKDMIQRAINAVELTFAIAPRRTIYFNFAVINVPGGGFSAAAQPIVADGRDGYEAPKKFWEATDFDGRAAGRLASSSKVEAVGAIKKTLFPTLRHMDMSDKATVPFSLTIQR